MIGYIWKQYGFELLFGLAVIVLVVIFIINLFTNKKGTYDDHTSIIKNLWSKNYTNKQPFYKPLKKPFESKGETECRRVIEKLTGKPFPKARPDFLKNGITGGNNLELDCYNPELKMAVEYNGEQHYKYIPHFHRTKDAFYNIKYRDDMKNRLCKENGITLITVPYTISLSAIEPFILKAIKL